MKNELLQSWALIAEIVSGIAVLVTLVVLIFQVSENTEATIAATYDSLVADMSEKVFSRGMDAEMAEIQLILRTDGYDALSELQKFQWDSTSLAVFLTYERAYIQWGNGHLTNSEWERFRSRICNGAPNLEQRLGARFETSLGTKFNTYRIHCSQ